MILRFIAENIASFKESVEFNTFPSSKSHSHENHKVVCDHATALRMSAVYGANGAGKSNLIDLARFLKDIVREGGIDAIKIDNRAFKFDKQCLESPSGLAVEFYNKKNIFYYHIEFDDERIVLEELYISKKTRDVKLFIRKDSEIELNADFIPKGFNEHFVSALDRLVRPEMLLLSFMGRLYPDEMPLVTDAYDWFDSKLRVIRPNSYAINVPHKLDTDEQFSALVNDIISDLKTGITQLVVRKEPLDEEAIRDSYQLQRIAQKAKQKPGVPQEITNDKGDVENVVFEHDKLWIKTLVPIHCVEGIDVEMEISEESDGTRRLIDYLPLFYDIVREDKVYVVDEIERSIHPILIKSLMSKLSESTDARGQLIFSTHESALLDQSIFRPDEIWFAQKDSEQATQLYPLSDYNIHKTANIENGYLNGRYGGIPFLSNLKDLHW